MFFSTKKNEYPCKPQIYYIKVGFKGVKIIWTCFRDAIQLINRRTRIQLSHRGRLSSLGIIIRLYSMNVSSWTSFILFFTSHSMRYISFCHIQLHTFFINITKTFKCLYQRGSSNEYPQSVFAEAVLTSTHNLCFSRNKKNNVYPCKPQFYYIKMEFKGGGGFIFLCFKCNVPLTSAERRKNDAVLSGIS